MKEGEREEQERQEEDFLRLSQMLSKVAWPDKAPARALFDTTLVITDEQARLAAQEWNKTIEDFFSHAENGGQHAKVTYRRRLTRITTAVAANENIANKTANPQRPRKPSIIKSPEEMPAARGFLDAIRQEGNHSLPQLPEEYMQGIAHTVGEIKKRLRDPGYLARQKSIGINTRGYRYAKGGSLPLENLMVALGLNPLLPRHR